MSSIESIMFSRTSFVSIVKFLKYSVFFIKDRLASAFALREINVITFLNNSNAIKSNLLDKVAKSYTKTINKYFSINYNYFTYKPIVPLNYEQNHLFRQELNNKAKLTHRYIEKEILLKNLSIYLISVDIFISLGKLEKAKQSLNLLKKITDKLSAGNFYKVSVMSCNDYLEALLGADLKQSIQNSLETQTMFKKLFGETNYYRNRHVFMSHKFLGELYEMNGDLVKAKQEYSVALQILKDVYSQSTCASTDKLSDIYGKLAIINIKLQQLSEALEYFKIHQQVFGMEHPRSIKLVNYFVDKKIDMGF